ncbi:hypothetical protein ACFE33_14960 [Falsihalocynthiibacter sp. SS001]|uniref:hypothetical protein n=1 Tax=Falsihalocynthiibacter sp. SS001 TaxID=3349698 RepID=UPI0036D3DE1E
MRVTKYGALMALGALPSAAMAQLLPDDGAVNIQNAISLQGGGWSQIKNLDELKVFTLDALFTIFLTAMIVYHPVRHKSRRTLADIEMPRLFFLYALVGLTVGFLVIQHGYIIGFVIFGIGALLRFRSNLDQSQDTVEMIIVTVLGLSVGMGLPILALLTALLTWCFLWLGWRQRGVEVVLKGASEEEVIAASANLEQTAQDAKWQLVNKHHVVGKTAITLLFQISGHMNEAKVETIISAAIPAEIDHKVNL